jgi:hypothetical protein
MYFQLSKLILWPRIDAPPRVLAFRPGIVNVISGVSKTGKSAVIPIIDYCLGANKCAIPVGVIRENCAWFGVVVDTIEGQKLLARREPGEQQSTGDMVLVEGPEVEIPHRLEEKTTNIEVVKRMLDRLAGLTTFDFEPNTESGFRSRPSFRDLMAFTFQPQNVVANPDVMFFKADTTEHREKLKTIFPYVLGAVTADVLQSRFEIEGMNRILRRKEAELRALASATDAWRIEAQGWLRQAIELGLLSADELIPKEWADIVDTLRRVVATNAQSARPTMAGIDVTLTRLEALRRDEAEVAAQLTEHRQRLNELRRLRESSEAYGGSLLVQRDRLALADWLSSLVEDEVEDPLVKVTQEERNRLRTLRDSLIALEVRIRSHPNVSDALDKEVMRRRSAAEESIVRLNGIRAEISILEREFDAARELTSHYDRVERFLGRLEQALQLYDRADQSSALRDEIAGLREQIAELQKVVSEVEIRRKLRNALSRVETTASRLVPRLDAEWPDAPVRLIIEDLTVKVIRGSRADYLWEIGSGANWLTYHVAMTLALQEFFLAEPHHPVPGLLVYDQPSRVYFPKRAGYEDEPDTPSWRDEEIAAVRKVFALLGEEVQRSHGRLQIIVLDHAGEDVWGRLAAVELTAEWRGEALVPEDWLTA